MTAQQVCDSILRNMEAVIVGCRGGFRPHLRALHFGGAARLARELLQFLNSGSIHRDKFGDEWCLPYLRSLYCPINGHLLRTEWTETKDIIDWIVEMIVEATLSDALIAVTSDASKLSDHYERDAPILCQTSVDRIIRGAKCLDEMDAEKLAEIQIAGITSSFTASSPPLPPLAKVVTVRPPKTRPDKKSSRSASISTTAEAESKVATPAASPPGFVISPVPPMLPSTAAMAAAASEFRPLSSSQLSSSCPGLTETGFRRFLISRNWSLPEDSETQEKIFEIEEHHPAASDVETVSSAASENNGNNLETKNNFSNLGARPKVKTSAETFKSPLSIFGSLDDEDCADQHPKTPPYQNGDSFPFTNGHLPAVPVDPATRHTHRRTRSDSSVKTTSNLFSVSGQNIRLPVVSETTITTTTTSSAGAMATPRNDEDYVEGYEDGPSHHPYRTFPNWPSGGPSSSGSWSELRPPSGGWMFPQPAFKEQSLFNYIISGQFSKHQASLDQDNAHLILAEAVINSSPCGMSLQENSRSPDPPEGSKRSTKAVDNHETSKRSTKTVDTTNSSSNDDAEAFADDDEDDESDEDDAKEVEEAVDHVERLKRDISRLVLSDGSPLREHSAEATALRLLLNLRDPHEPKASELRYLVSEQDAPQKLLPLPPRFVAFQPETEQNGACADNSSNGAEANGGNIDIDVDEDEFGESTAIRGTLFWAPPRPQLILKIHKKPRNAKEAMLEQNYLCHDCGMKVEREFVHTFRFCFYFGKFACTTCHSNKTHVLPANIIQKWDFKEYRVSDFAHNVLRGLSTDHLFAVVELNPELPKQIRKLRKAIEMRQEAFKMAVYIVVCRLAKLSLSDFKECVQITDPTVFSLNELCDVKSGLYVKNLKQTMTVATEHILQCELCTGRGFICEGCHSNETLFPFQLETVTQCVDCNACYHKNCVKSPCSKCVRLKKR